MTATKRSKVDRKLSDAACTPKPLADLLGQFDIDPCSNPRSIIHADRTYSLEQQLDGLKLPWNGRAYVNWPYGDPLPWARKMVAELFEGRCSEAVVLCKLDCSTVWWEVATAPVKLVSDLSISLYPDLWLFHDRIQFGEHPELIELRRREIAEGKRKGPKDGTSSNNFCSAIIHHRRGAPALKLSALATRWERASS